LVTRPHALLVRLGREIVLVDGDALGEGADAVGLLDLRIR
jgi:hypothetical protein